jgi:hypothetical protein
MGRLFPGSRAESITASDLSRIEDDVEVRFALTVPRCAQPDGAGLRFTPFGATSSYVEAYASLSTRRHDLDLAAPRDTRFRYRYRLPPGWRVAELPEPSHGQGPFGEFRIRYQEEDGAVVAEGRVLIPARRVTVKDYPAFRNLMVELDRALARRVRIAPAPAGRGSP